MVNKLRKTILTDLNLILYTVPIKAAEFYKHAMIFSNLLSDYFESGSVASLYIQAF